MDRAVLFPHATRDSRLETTVKAAVILAELGISCVLPEQLAGKRELPDFIERAPLEEAFAEADVCISLGGDGTLLQCARIAAEHNIPILGINLGNTGFLTELERGELDFISGLVRPDSFTLDSRMMLDVRICKGKQLIGTSVALNDAVITRGSSAQTVGISLFVDGRLVSEFMGDGIIVATPTGSTGYSMSAGGPIVEPDAENIVVTPICAHALYAHSFILSLSREVSVLPQRAGERMTFLTVDGAEPIRLRDGWSVRIKRSELTTNIIRLKKKSFYEIVNHKLKKG